MKNAILLVFILTLSATTWAQFEHPDLKAGKKHVRRVVLMPISAEIVKVGIKGGEPMVEESRKLEKNLLPVVADVLRDTGCEVNDTAFTEDAFAKDPDVRYLADDLRKQYDALLQQMTRKSKDVRKGRYSIGDSVTKLAAGSDVDALVFVTADGQVLTGGKKTFDWLLLGPAFDYVRIRVGVVDAATGEVLYFAKPVTLKNLTKNAAEAKGALKRSFKNFVKVNAGPNKTQPANPASAASGS